MKPLLAFDLDGTLIDSAQDIADAVNLTLTRHHKPTVDFDTVVAHIGDGLRKLISDFFPEFMGDWTALHQLEEEFLRTYETQMFNHTKPFPGAIEFLESWKGPLGIITNKNEAPAKELIKHLAMAHLPWVRIFGADSLAEKKPSPLPLKTMMELADRNPEQTLMIGDGTPDMISAQRAGVRSVAIRFGYTAEHLLQQYQPIAFLDHYSEMDKLLKGLNFHA